MQRGDWPCSCTERVPSDEDCAFEWQSRTHDVEHARQRILHYRRADAVGHPLPQRARDRLASRATTTTTTRASRALTRPCESSVPHCVGLPFVMAASGLWRIAVVDSGSCYCTSLHWPCTRTLHAVAAAAAATAAAAYCAPPSPMRAHVDSRFSWLTPWQQLDAQQTTAAVQWKQGQ